MKINKSIPFLILVAIAAFSLPVAPVMAITGLYIPPGETTDLNAASMDLDCGDLVVDGTLNMDTGTMDNVGSVIINASGTINLDDGTLYLTKDWTNNGGTVNPGNGSQVTWDTDCGAPNIKVIGNSSFFNLTLETTSGRLITFQAGSVNTINGKLLLSGNNPGGLLTIRSHIPGSQSFLVVNGTFMVTGVDVADNNAKLPGEWIDFGAPSDFQSIDSGNNYRWFRSGPGAVTPFRIEKIWDQVGDTSAIPVTAHLSCTGANQTQQNVVFTATTDAILFVYDLWLIPEGERVDCTITEDVPPGYRATYNCNGDDCGDSGQGVDACFYSPVDRNEDRVCTIINRPLPAIVTVTKTWVIEGADQGYDGGHFIVGICDSVVRGPTSDDGCFQGTCFAAVRQEGASAGSKDYEFTVTKPRYPWTECTFFEDADDSVVESDNGCGRLRLSAGDEVECEIVNTVFFEGIPTLNQYGMAILALLMLGVGMIGFRRFV